MYDADADIRSDNTRDEHPHGLWWQVSVRGQHLFWPFQKPHALYRAYHIDLTTNGLRLYVS